MSDSALYMNLPYQEAIDFFMLKTNTPTEAWDVLWQEANQRAFTVAGAMEEELLEGLREAVDQAISQGTTLADFRKSFDSLVEKFGWAYKGSRGWRTQVIYQTNLSVAYARGHWQQMTNEHVRKVRPFLRYVPSSSANPRPDHARWGNLVLPWDHPFWDTHAPPNGWGCKCGLVSVSAREIERLKAQGINISTEAPEIQYYDWTNPRTEEVIQVPKGIDPGWAYNPGKMGWRDAA